MELKELAAKLEIEEYPEEFEAIYKSLNGDNTKFLDKEAFDKLEAEYKILDEYYDEVMAVAEELRADKELSLWASVVTEYSKVASREETGKIKFPKRDSAANDMMTIFPLLALAPMTIEFYKSHGFSTEEIHGIFNVFRISLRLFKAAKGRAGYGGYYSWTRLYVYGDIYDYTTFNFQFRKLDAPVMLIRNKESGEFSVIMTDGKYHSSGLVLGAAGSTEEEGSFEAEFSETDEAWVAHEAIGGYVCRELSTFKKSEWECIVTTGDEVLSLHIPRNVDFSAKAIDESIDVGIKMAKERFPERKPKIVFCNSWLLDPHLAELLGDESKIVAFGNRFMRYPFGAGNGRAGFGFVFLGYDENKLEELPEDTSLRRKLKAFWMNGGNTAFVPGFMTDRIIED